MLDIVGYNSTNIMLITIAWLRWQKDLSFSLPMTLTCNNQAL